MSPLYVAVLAVIVVTLLSVALYRTSQVKTKACGSPRQST
jgi:hypothetical protein